MRIYDFKEYQRYHRMAGEFGWTLREYKEVVRAVDSLFEDLNVRGYGQFDEGRDIAEEAATPAKNSGDSASASP